MIVLLSPSKNMALLKESKVYTTIPIFESYAQDLAKILSTKSIAKLMELMQISEKLAKENYDRFQKFGRINQIKQLALLSYTGEVYNGLEASKFTSSDWKFAQDHLRILSALYGVLRPSDGIMPYRLEMAATKINSKISSMYQFWSDKIGLTLLKEQSLQENNLFINLASDEYFKVLKPYLSKQQIVNIDFKEERNGKLVFISTNAKRARGLMAKYIIKNRIKDINGIKKFDLEGYTYVNNSDQNETLLFTKKGLIKT